ncbi:MAG TPA: hypothetical protein VJH97_02220 [Candidatus Nanoarchaeia archaeon]|nr:hypothetical protein [Candidatus Nanoarchaeia archaeon]
MANPINELTDKVLGIARSQFKPTDTSWDKMLRSIAVFYQLYYDGIRESGGVTTVPNQSALTEILMNICLEFDDEGTLQQRSHGQMKHLHTVLSEAFISNGKYLEFSFDHSYAGGEVAEAICANHLDVQRKTLEIGGHPVTADTFTVSDVILHGYSYYQSGGTQGLAAYVPMPLRRSIQISDYLKHELSVQFHWLDDVSEMPAIPRRSQFSRRLRALDDAFHFLEWGDAYKRAASTVSPESTFSEEVMPAWSSAYEFSNFSRILDMEVPGLEFKEDGSYTFAEETQREGFRTMRSILASIAHAEPTYGYMSKIMKFIFQSPRNTLENQASQDIMIMFCEQIFGKGTYDGNGFADAWQHMTTMPKPVIRDIAAQVYQRLDHEVRSR